MTDLLNALIQSGTDVRAVHFHNGWLEFDTNEDYEQAIEAVVAYPNEVMDYIAELECMGEPYAQAMGAAYAVVMA
jgi:NDP-sugar pyrophosphorylase family protein